MKLFILEHKNVKVFVTHGGLLGTLESIYYKVPMIGFPLFGDQFYNMKVCEDREIAISLDYHKFTANDFLEALNVVLKNNNYRWENSKFLEIFIYKIRNFFFFIYRNNIEEFSKLYYDRPMSSQKSVIFWVNYVLRHGNILRSPAVDLAWYQVELLDVYGFLLLNAIFLIYISFLIIRTFYILIYHTKRFDKIKILSKKWK